GDYFGASVAISGDYAIAGAYADNDSGSNSGSAYIFKREGSTWIQQIKLTAGDGAAYDYFGRSVSISGDYAIVGTNGDDDTGLESGSAYIFKRNESNWIQQDKLTAGDGAAIDYFGNSVFISGDYAIVGAYGDDNNRGSTYIYKRDGSSWTQQIKLTASDRGLGDLFGFSVSISGNYAIVGAYGDDDAGGSASGSVYTFKRNGNSWIQQDNLLAGDGAKGDYFGYSVSISNDDAIVGAYGDDDNGVNSGSAYIYDDLFFVQPESIYLEISTADAYPGDTVQVSLNVQFPLNTTFSSAEINIGGYLGSLDFVDVVTDSSLTGDASWTYQTNETDSLNIVWFAGSGNISGEGTLFSLKFFVPDTASGFIPITLESAVFNTGENPVELISGGVNVNDLISNYGDVDLNGDIQAFDASLILKYLVNSIELNTQQLLNANVSLDTTVSALDATLILQYGVGIIDSLPYDTSLGLLFASGNIEMENQQIQVGQTIDIPLTLSNGDNILSFEGKIVFNLEHLTYTGIVWSESVEGFMIETNIEDGEVKFAAAGTLPDGEKGIIAILQFTVNEDFVEDETTVALQRLRWNEEAIMEEVATATLFTITGIDENLSETPSDYALNQNYPNPFNPTTTIRYEIPHSVHVKLTIYDTNGRNVATLVDRRQNAGWYNIQWNGVNSKGRSVSSGVYLMRLEAGDFVDAKKILMMK
ncbi:MAG: T9SS type A sorting domain-containing protein, partial [Proteobacteria bacterium]|nr:T9SS type A sorting domain-containing protein [Pseudomonadota bacterium]